MAATDLTSQKKKKKNLAKAPLGGSPAPTQVPASTHKVPLSGKKKKKKKKRASDADSLILSSTD
eukprot:CAMPEP_0113945174 /NCGR_PEP_ID=MMETSP1339-20121228/39918_1 /TAXON_ID=94617 /ORGANISM="Fibrocapsa japonica" /LENGTH=63 /DNA_ID=CAMNT_0000950617 /DNA_START=63 /DNA_END=251 /DNA_ORIENTATION=+ /assembly_acc=CAM_ASM_000762